MKIRGLFCGILVLGSFVICGQNINRNDFYEADMLMLDGDFYTAQKTYERLLLLEPDNANLNYLNGYCLLHIQGRKKESLQFLEKAVPKISAEYKAGRHKETNAPLDALKYYALACKVNNDIPKAIDILTQYKSMLNPRQKNEIADTELLIQSCYTSMKIQENPIYFRKHSLGENLKINNSQTYPVVNQDETMLFYSVSGKRENDKIYFAEKKDGEWSSPKEITSELGVKTKCYPNSITYDNNRLYLTAVYGLSTDIFYSELYKGRWKRMIRVEKPISGKKWDAEAWESSDGRYLYFSSDRKGGYGKMDLYMSVKDSKGRWKNPENLGEKINTPENESMPMVNRDHTKLYFKSEGHENVGGYDIFVSEKTGDEWGEPVNIGYPINTPDDDIHFMPLDNEIYAYTAVQSPSNGNKFELEVIEIFSEKHPRIFDITGNVVLEEGDGLEGTKIEVYNKDTYQNLASAQPELISGVYNLEIPAGNYMINYTRPGYKAYTQLLNLPMNNPEDELVINAFLEKEEPVAEEVPVVAEAIVEEAVPEPTYLPEPVLEAESESREPVHEEPEAVYQQTAVEAPDDTPIEVYHDGKYTVQFLATIKRKPIEYWDGKYKVEIQKGTDEFYRYITGVFNSIEDARSLRSEIASTLYKDAFIRYYNLDDYLNHAALNSPGMFTIQLMALKENTNPKELSTINNLKVNYGEDGWYRYTTGEFSSLTDARHALNDLNSKGYKNAFIRLHSLDDYLAQAAKIRPVTYTIQFMALKKEANPDGLGVPDKVKVSYGEDGWYRYTTGEFKSLASARHALNDIISRGFKDAYIRKISEVSNY